MRVGQTANCVENRRRPSRQLFLPQPVFHFNDDHLASYAAAPDNQMKTTVDFAVIEIITNSDFENNNANNDGNNLGALELRIAEFLDEENVYVMDVCDT